MSTGFRFDQLWPFIDLALFPNSKEPVKQSISFLTPPKEAVKKLSQASVIYIHPDGFDRWTDILLELQQAKPLPVKLIILADSDYAFGDEHMEALLVFFPQTHFWIQNWCGDHERVKLLPIGVNATYRSTRSKTKELAISYFLTYEGFVHREEYAQFLAKYPCLSEFRIPKVGFEEYCERVSECWFSLCPMGGGYDTYRFWETLMVGTIPVVKKHPFFESLRQQYPKLPFLMLDQWTDLLEHLPVFNETTYLQFMKDSDCSCLFTEYWIQEFNSLREFSDTRGKVAV